MKLKSLIDRVANESNVEHDETVVVQKPKDSKEDLSSSDSTNEHVKDEPVTTVSSTDEDGETVEEQLSDAIKKKGKDVTAVEVGNESLGEEEPGVDDGDENPDTVLEVASNTQSQETDVDQQEPNAPGPEVDAPEDNELQVPPETSVEEDSVADPEPTEEQVQAEDDAEINTVELTNIAIESASDPISALRQLFVQFGQDLQTTMSAGATPAAVQAATENFADGVTASISSDKDVLEYDDIQSDAFSNLLKLLGTLSDVDDVEETKVAVESFTNLIREHGQNRGVAEAVRLGLSMLDRDLDVSTIFPAQEAFDDDAVVAQSTATDQLEVVAGKVEEARVEAGAGIPKLTGDVIKTVARESRGQLEAIDSLQSRLDAAKAEPKTTISVNGFKTNAFLDSIANVSEYERLAKYADHMEGYLGKIVSVVSALKEAQAAYATEEGTVDGFVDAVKGIVADFPLLETDIETEEDNIKTRLVKRFFGNGGLKHQLPTLDSELKGFEYLERAIAYLPVVCDCTDIYYGDDNVEAEYSTRGTLSIEDSKTAATALKKAYASLAKANGSDDQGDELVRQLSDLVVDVMNTQLSDAKAEEFDSRQFIIDFVERAYVNYGLFVGFAARAAHIGYSAISAFVGSAEINAVELAENAVTEPEQETVAETTEEDAEAEVTEEVNEEAETTDEEVSDVTGDEGEASDESNA